MRQLAEQQLGELKEQLALLREHIRELKAGGKLSTQVCVGGEAGGDAAHTGVCVGGA